MNRVQVVIIAVIVSILFAMPVFARGGQETSARPAIELMPDEPFNPDTAAGVDFTDMRRTFGAIPDPGSNVRLGAVAKAFENEYWRTLRSGMQTAETNLKDRGYDVLVDVRSALGEGDEQGQLAVVNDMINKDYSALLLSPITDSNLIPGVERAARAGIPTINVNDGLINIAPNFVGPRAVQNGELAAEWISARLGGQGKVAIVIGMPTAFAARQRTLGFQSWMQQNAPGIQIVEQQNADWNRQRAKELAEIWINKHADLAAIFCNNDTMALGVQEAVNASGREILVVGVDGIGEAYDSIRAGEMAATVDSFPFYKGQIAVEVALRVLGGQELPRVIWTPQALIDSSNVNVPAAQIINWQDPQFAR